VQADNGSTIVHAAEKVGINIPTLCYDKRLVGHGACRICVVEVAGARSLMASCTVPVTEGMVVETHSPSVIQARKDILKLILANHPLDCMTCEKAGNCKLQDYCYEYDIKESGISGAKNNYPIDDSNPFFYLDRNKCIMCGKCIRVDNELQCTGAINYNKRGFDTHVGMPYEREFEQSTCVSCGNCVSVCPVGALTSKSNTKFRTWETKKVRTTCSYCGVGCQMELEVKNNKVVGVQPVFDTPNDGLLCVKGKYGYKFIDHPDRLKTPMIKKDGQFVEATWNEAYSLIADKMNSTKESYGSDAFGGFSSARCTNEENYLMQKLFRAVIGTNNIDHCARL
jgi:formate dehydrogenase major subunit